MHRGKIGISQEDLARDLGYKNGQFISNVERALCSVPGKELPKLCKRLEIPKEEIIFAVTKDLADNLEVFFKAGV